MADTATQVATNGHNPEATAKAKEDLARIGRIDELRAKDWKVDLPDGGWAKLRDPAVVTEGQIKRLKEARATIEAWDRRMDQVIKDNNFGLLDILVQRQAAAATASEDVAVAMFVETWSYEIDVPQPHEPSSLRRLTAEVYRELQKVAADLLQYTRVDPEPSSMQDDTPFPEPVD